MVIKMKLKPMDYDLFQELEILMMEWEYILLDVKRQFLILEYIIQQLQL